MSEWGVWVSGMCGGWLLDDLTLRPWAWKGSRIEAEALAASLGDGCEAQPMDLPEAVMPNGWKLRERFKRRSSHDLPDMRH